MPFIPLEKIDEQPKRGFIPLDEELRELIPQTVNSEISVDPPLREQLSNKPSPTATLTGKVFPEQDTTPRGFIPLAKEQEPEDPYDEDNIFNIIGKSVARGAIVDTTEAFIAAEKIKQRTEREAITTFRPFLPKPAGGTTEKEKQERAVAVYELTGAKQVVPPAPVSEKPKEAPWLEHLERGVETNKEFLKLNIKPESRFKQQLAQASQSIGNMLATLPLGGVKLMAVVSGLQKAGEVNEAGEPLSTVYAAGAIQGFTEWVTELDPTEQLLKKGVPFFKRLARGAVSEIPGELIATATEMWVIDEKLRGGKAYTKDEWIRALTDTAIVAGMITVGATSVAHPTIKKQEALETAIEDRKQRAQEVISTIEKAYERKGFVPIERTTEAIQGDIEVVKGTMLDKAFKGQPAEAEAEMLRSLESELGDSIKRSEELPSQEQVISEHKDLLHKREARLDKVNDRLSKLKESAETIKEEGSLNREKRQLEKDISTQKEVVKSVEEQPAPEAISKPEPVPPPEKKAKKGQSFLSLTNSEMNRLQKIKADIEAGEARVITGKRDLAGEQLEGTAETGGTYPEYFKGKGYTYDDALGNEIRKRPSDIRTGRKKEGAINKALRGKSLTEAEQIMVEDLLEGYKDDTLRRIVSERVKPTETPAIDLNIGDTYKEGGEQFEVKEVLDNGNIVVEDGTTKTLSPDDTVSVDRGTLKKKRGFIPLDEGGDFTPGGLASKTGHYTPSEEKPLIEMPELVELTRDINEGKYPIIRRNLRNKYGLHKSTGGPFGEADIFLKADIFTGDLIGGISVKPQVADVMYENFKETFIDELDPESGITENELVFQKDYNKRTGQVDIKVYRKNPQLAAGITAHEIGHHIDYMDDKDLKRGNILGRLKSLKRYAIQTIDALPTDPSQVLTSKDRGQLMRDATKQAGTRPKDKTTPEFKVWQQNVKSRYQALLKAEITARGLITRDEVMQELRDVSQERSPFDPKADESYTKYRYSSVELYADAISAFVNTPDMFKRMAPKFRKSFLAYMENKPQVKSVYDSIIDRIGRGREEVVDARIDRDYKMFEEGDVAREELNERNKERVEKIYDTLMRGLTDKEHAKLKPIRQQELRGGEIGKAAQEARFDIEEIPYISSEVDSYLYAVNKVVESARDLGVTKADIAVYATNKRITTERQNIANPGGTTDEAAAEKLARLPALWGQEKFDAVVRAVEEYRKLREELIIPKMEESGDYDPETIQLIKENTDYFKFSVFKHFKNKFGSGIAGKIHKQVGTLSGIENPFIATVMTDVSIMRAIAINKQKKSLVGVLSESPIADILTPAKMRWSKDLGARVPVEPNDSNLGILTILEEGKPLHFYVSKEIADSYKFDPARAMLITRAWAAISAPVRAVLVNKNPLWMAGNVIKDLDATIKNNPEIKLTDSLKLLADYKAALGDVWKDVMRGERSEEIQTLLREKAILANRAYSTKEQSFDDELERMLDSFSITAATEAPGALDKLKKAWDFLDKLGKVSERTGKVAGYKYLKHRTDISDREIFHRVRVRIGTPDVKRQGAWQLLTNNIFMFSNVGKEGFRSSYESYKADPGGYAWKTVAMNVLPKAALAAFGWAVMTSDDDDMKILMNNIPDYDNKNYTVIPLFLTDDNKTIYLRIPEDYQGQLFGALTWDAAHGRFTGKDGALKTAYESQPYKLNPIIKLGLDLVTYYIKGNNPQEDYNGRKVINDLAFQSGGLEAHKAMMKHAWRSLGGNALYRPAYNINRDKSSIEKILSIPPFNVLGKFVRISDRGTSEKYYKTLAESRKEGAKKSLAAQRSIVDGVNDGKDNDAIIDNLEELDLLTPRSGNQIRKYRALKVDNPEVNAIALARSSKERQILISEFRKTMTEKEVDEIMDKWLDWKSIGEGE